MARKGSAGSKASSRKKREGVLEDDSSVSTSSASKSTYIVVSDDEVCDDATSSSCARHKLQGAQQTGRRRGGGSCAPSTNVVIKSLLEKLDELRQAEEGGEKQAFKRPKGKKKGAAKGAPVRGWSKGTGFGGSNEISKKDEDLQQRARAREQELDASFTTLMQQLLEALERQQTPESDTCFMLLSCSGLGWCLHRLLAKQSLMEIGRRSATYKHVLALLSFLARSDQRSPQGKHIYASLLVQPLQQKGWAGVTLPLVEADAAGACKDTYLSNKETY